MAARAAVTALLFAPLLMGCAALAAAPPRPKVASVAAVPITASATAPAAAPPLPVIAAAAAPESAPEEAKEALVLGPDATAVGVAAGRFLVDVHVPASAFVSIGVFGVQEALLGFDVVSVVRPADATPIEGALAPLRVHRPLDEDGLLPRIVSFRSPSEPAIVRILVDAAEPVEVQRASAPVVEVVQIPKKGRPPKLVQEPIIGFPAPAAREDGYFLQSAARYQFARTDVIAALLAAFRRTRVRFKRDPIAIADITQWDGIRPATDLGRPRHISHEGGRDVDVALAASDEEPSTVRAHCTGVLIEQSVQGCGPGTARGFDAQRMAYFLGVLFETMPPVEKIFVDDVYLRELRRAAETLHDRRLLKDAGFEGLHDDAIVRASPWHTDHLHVRFAGPAGKPAF
jgi:hypothetical protein